MLGHDVGTSLGGYPRGVWGGGDVVALPSCSSCYNPALHTLQAAKANAELLFQLTQPLLIMMQTCGWGSM